MELILSLLIDERNKAPNVIIVLHRKPNVNNVQCRIQELMQRYAKMNCQYFDIKCEQKKTFDACE